MAQLPTQKMNRSALLILFAASVGLIVWDKVVPDRSGATFDSFSVIGAVFAFAFGRILLLEKLLESRAIKLGSESLPPIKDVAHVIAGESALTDPQKKILLKALLKSKRAVTCGKVAREIPFQIVDHWGGIWNLIAYEDTEGQRGFVINRVAYAGKNAGVVAECVGIR